jgi:branched-chain amino acid aminotransferase
MSIYASVDGVVLPAAEARISVLDNGFTFGDSVYETLRTYGGRPFHLGRHLARLRASANRVGIALPLADADLAERLDALLVRSGPGERYIRVIVSRGVGDVSYHFERIAGPTVVMITKPFAPMPAALYDDGIDVVVTRVRRNHPDTVDPAIKSGNLLNNILAVREAQARGAFEPILLNLEGNVAEGASSNVFVVSGGALVTPPLEAGILAGVTRALVLEIARAQGLVAREETVTPAAFSGADEAFITSTLKELVPIRRIDGAPVGDGRPGPVTLQLLRAFRAQAAGA